MLARHLERAEEGSAQRVSAMRGEAEQPCGACAVNSCDVPEVNSVEGTDDSVFDVTAWNEPRTTCEGEVVLLIVSTDLAASRI